MDLLFSLAFFLCMAWFGLTFIYFLSVVRKSSDGKVGSLSLMKDINQIGKIYKKFLAIKMQHNPNTSWPKVLVISNVISFLIYAGLFVILLIYSIMSDIM